MSAAVPADELRELYRELILDHARNPRNFGPLDAATHHADGINPLCGDRLVMHVEVRNEQLQKVQFEGSGCAISMASASLLTETVAGLDAKAALATATTVSDRLAGRADAAVPERLYALDGVREFPGRVKCATLAWHALRAALENDQTPATTE